MQTVPLTGNETTDDFEEMEWACGVAMAASQLRVLRCHLAVLADLRRVLKAADVAEGGSGEDAKEWEKDGDAAAAEELQLRTMLLPLPQRRQVLAEVRLGDARGSWVGDSKAHMYLARLARGEVAGTALLDVKRRGEEEVVVGEEEEEVVAVAGDGEGDAGSGLMGPAEDMDAPNPLAQLMADFAACRAAGTGMLLCALPRGILAACQRFMEVSHLPLELMLPYAAADQPDPLTAAGASDRPPLMPNTAFVRCCIQGVRMQVFLELTNPAPQ